MENKKRFDLLALASIPLIMTLGNSMLIPVLPNIEKKINITQLQSSLIISIYSIVSIILIPIAGYLSDRFGRKKVIIPSLIVTAAGGLISGLSGWLIQSPYWMILFGRLVQGIGSSGAFPVVIPTVGDMYKNETDVSKGLGIIETSNTFGKVLSPILGSLFAAWIWFMPFLFIPIFSLISIILVAIFVKVPKKTNANTRICFKDFCGQLKTVLKKKGNWLYAIFVLGLISMFVYFGFLFYFSSALDDIYNIKGIKRGLIIAIPLLFLCITSFVIGKIIGKHKILMKWIIFSGSILTAASLFTLGIWNNFSALLILLSSAGSGIGAALPCLDSLITEGVEKEQRGTITCIYSSMRLLGVALGPPAIALLTRTTIFITFLVLSIIALAAAVITLTSIKPPKKRENQND